MTAIRFVFVFVLVGTIQPLFVSASIITLPTDLKAGDKYHLAFVTSTATTTAFSSDIGFYDAIVQSLADAVPELDALGVTWKVIGSTATVDAVDHINVTAPVYMLNDTRIADDSADLFDDLVVPLNRSEMNTAQLGAAWTGTGNDGRAFVPLGDVSGSSRRGAVTFSNFEWINFDTRSHGGGPGGSPVQTFRLYGISEELTAVPEPATIAIWSALAGFGIAFRGWRRKRK